MGPNHVALVSARATAYTRRDVIDRRTGHYDAHRVGVAAVVLRAGRTELRVGALQVSGGLEAAVRAGRPGYAAVDVYEHEPVADDPLLHLDKVVCTPHLGYVEKGTYESFFASAFEHVRAFATEKR